MRDKKSIHGTRRLFDNFSKELMNKLPEKEQTSTPQETITTWQRINLGYIWQLCFVD